MNYSDLNNIIYFWANQECMFPIKDSIPANRFPIMNWLIILLNTAIFIYQLQLTDTQLGVFFMKFGLIPSHYNAWHQNDFLSLRLFTVFPFITNIFLHGGWLHFIANMWTLVIFGDNVENRMGSFRYLAFYLLCGILASITHSFININSVVPAIGASGAIAGVMAAYMFLFPFAKVVLLLPVLFVPLFFNISAFIYIGIWFLIQLWNGGFLLKTATQSSGIAFWAHIGGFISGVLLFSLFLKKKYKNP
jgi:membrane associated rhomboid family serine protease